MECSLTFFCRCDPTEEDFALDRLPKAPLNHESLRQTRALVSQVRPYADLPREFAKINRASTGFVVTVLFALTAIAVIAFVRGRRYRAELRSRKRSPALRATPLKRGSIQIVAQAKGRRGRQGCHVSHESAPDIAAGIANARKGGTLSRCEAHAVRSQLSPPLAS